jgi:hypothetical protein
MDPIKLLEYLGAGLPVVATPLPGLAGRDGVRIGEGDAFVAAVRSAVAEGRRRPPDDLADWSDVADTLLRHHAGALL